MSAHTQWTKTFLPEFHSLGLQYIPRERNHAKNHHLHEWYKLHDISANTSSIATTLDFLMQYIIPFPPECSVLCPAALHLNYCLTSPWHRPNECLHHFHSLRVPNFL